MIFFRISFLYLNTFKVLAAGILQGEFFTEEHPKYINFGAIGHIIGHEISHSFDSLGRLFDNFGNYNDWWDSESKENYLQKQKCIVEQYNNYTVKEVSLNVSEDSLIFIQTKNL